MDSIHLTKNLVIGIDPGLANIGFCALNGNEILTRTIKSKSCTNLGRRLEAILGQLKDFESIKPEIVVLEKQPPNLSSEIHIATGAILGHLGAIEIRYWTPRSLKKNICGSSTANKIDMMLKMSELTGCHFGTDHEADACALAYATVRWDTDVLARQKNTKQKDEISLTSIYRTPC